MNQILQIHGLFNPFSLSIPYWGKLSILFLLYSFLCICAISLFITLKQNASEEKMRKEANTAHLLEAYDKLKALGGGTIIITRPFSLEDKVVKGKLGVCGGDNISIAIRPELCFIYSEDVHDNDIFFGWS